jgi:hypothetical protein
VLIIPNKNRKRNLKSEICIIKNKSGWHNKNSAVYSKCEVVRTLSYAHKVKIIISIMEESEHVRI